MATGPKRPSRGRDAPTTGRGRAGNKPPRPAAESVASRSRKTPAPSKKPIKVATRKPARGQAGRKGLAGGGGRTDSVLAARLEAIAHGLEQVDGLRADLDEVRTLVGTLAQTLGTLAQTVEALLASSQRQNRGPAREATAETRQASAEDGAPAAENEAAPEPHD
jgi:hypothetical protein